MKKDWSTVKSLLYLLKPYRKVIVFILGCIVLDMVIQLIMPLLNQRLIDKGILEQDYRIVVQTCLLLFTLFLVGRLLEYIEFIKYTGVRNKLNYMLQYKSVRHILKMKLAKFQDTNHLEMVKKIDLYIENICKILSDTIMQSIAGSLKIVGGMTGLFIINWKLALVLLFFIPLKLIGVQYFYKLQKKHFEGLIDAYRKSAFWYGDTMNGIMEIKLWGIFRQKLSQLKRFQRDVYKASFKISNSARMNVNYEAVLQELITGVIIYLLAARLIFVGELTLGGLFSFITYSVYVLGPISALANIKFEMASIIPAYKSYTQFMEEGLEQDKTRVVANAWHPSRMPHKISFQNVCLNYGGDEILKNVSFTINKGNKVAIVGANGCGKSSLINVLLRFYEPTAGNVYIDEVDIQTVDIDVYRQLFGVMSQVSYLFDTSIKENIMLYTKYNNAEIQSSVRKSMAEEFILNLPNQYDTKVGNNGAKLSGGERQKVAMSRVMIKKSGILVLDEATANFDYESEKQFNQFIRESGEYEFVFIISHRPEILKSVDMILFMEQGVLRAIGSYEQLKDEMGGYSIWNNK